MGKWVIAAFVTASLCSGPVAAATDSKPGQKPLLSTGVGGVACSAFNQIKAADPKSANDNFMSWAQGYMSGSNAERHTKRANLNSLSPDETWKRLADYCAAHPKDSFLQGVLVLYRSLDTLP